MQHYDPGDCFSVFPKQRKSWFGSSDLCGLFVLQIVLCSSIVLHGLKVRHSTAPVFGDLARLKHLFGYYSNIRSVSILKFNILLLILSPILHGSSYSSLDETAHQKNVSSPLGSSEFYLTSDVFFVRQTATKCPVLLQFLHCLPLAWQISVWRCLRLHLPQRLPSCWLSFTFVRQNSFPFFRWGTWPWRLRCTLSISWSCCVWSEIS